LYNAHLFISKVSADGRAMAMGYGPKQESLGEVKVEAGSTLTYDLLNTSCYITIDKIEKDFIELTTNGYHLGKPLKKKHKLTPKHFCNLTNQIFDVSEQLEILLTKIEQK